MNNLEEEWKPKLYLVSRRDLPPGVQSCQIIHAWRDFLQKHSTIEEIWYRDSNHVAFLSAENKEALDLLTKQAAEQNIIYTAFFEPDLNYELTAAVFEPTIASRDLLRKLPTALKEYKKDWLF